MSEGKSFEQIPSSGAGESHESREEPGKYLYHRVPPQLEGDALHPLNVLREKYPDVYQQEVTKYQGRERLMQQHLPNTDVLWNDVLHLTPVHPSDVKQAYIEAGGTSFPSEWYRIPVGSLDSIQATLFHGSLSDPEQGLQEQDVDIYNPEQLHTYAQLPEETRQYYREELSAGRRPLLFLHVPHVLYRGSIPLSSCEKITV